MANIEREDWARVWAKALLDSTFRATLEKNPINAVTQFRNTVDPDFPNPPKLIDDLKEYEMDTGKEFSDMSETQLNRIINRQKEVKIKRNKLSKP